jgi:hypothetical protein
MTGSGESPGNCSPAENSPALPGCFSSTLSSFNQVLPDEYGSVCISKEVILPGPQWSNNPIIKRITFETGSQLKGIAKKAFASNESLESVFCPPSLCFLRGFNRCPRLREVLFAPESVLYKIDGFAECPSLFRIEIPSSVEILGEDSFMKCTGLNEIIFATDSHLKIMSGFCGCSSLIRIDIPSSVEIIKFSGFDECTKLNEVIFAVDSHLRVIDEFRECLSLIRIDIPSSVEIIHAFGFSECTRLNEVIFAVDSHLRNIYGFQRCSSLTRMEIPSSVKSICSYAFSKCSPGLELIFPAGTQITEVGQPIKFMAFVVYLDNNGIKQHRRRIHLSIYN